MRFVNEIAMFAQFWSERFLKSGIGIAIDPTKGIRHRATFGRHRIEDRATGGPIDVERGQLIADQLFLALRVLRFELIRERSDDGFHSLCRYFGGSRRVAILAA